MSRAVCGRELGRRTPNRRRWCAGPAETVRALRRSRSGQRGWAASAAPNQIGHRGKVSPSSHVSQLSGDCAREGCCLPLVGRYRVLIDCCAIARSAKVLMLAGLMTDFTACAPMAWARRTSNGGAGFKDRRPRWPRPWRPQADDGLIGEVRGGGGEERRQVCGQPQGIDAAKSARSGTRRLGMTQRRGDPAERAHAGRGQSGSVGAGRSRGRPR